MRSGEMSNRKRIAETMRHISGWITASLLSDSSPTSWISAQPFSKKREVAGGGGGEEKKTHVSFLVLLALCLSVCLCFFLSFIVSAMLFQMNHCRVISCLLDIFALWYRVARLAQWPSQWLVTSHPRWHSDSGAGFQVLQSRPIADCKTLSASFCCQFDERLAYFCILFYFVCKCAVCCFGLSSLISTLLHNL